MYTVIYINSRGNQVSKQFQTEEERQSFVALLDKRIEKGTCGGYILTSRV